jgi:hypothetical protein
MCVWTSPCDTRRHAERGLDESGIGMDYGRRATTKADAVGHHRLGAVQSSEAVT